METLLTLCIVALVVRVDVFGGDRRDGDMPVEHAICGRVFGCGSVLPGFAPAILASSSRKLCGHGRERRADQIAVPDTVAVGGSRRRGADVRASDIVASNGGAAGIMGFRIPPG
jgi:hypothetical protein